METKNAKVERCPHCKANMKAFWHTINAGLVGILIKAIQFVKEKNRNEFHLQKDLHLTVNQFSNFTKLRFHGLVAKMDGKSGYWLITKRGGEFLRGETKIPSQVKTFRNKVQEHSLDLVHIARFKKEFPSFDTVYAYEYQKPVGITRPIVSTLF